MKHVLLMWNAMASKQVSGGDMYTKKFIENSESKFDVILSEHARLLLRPNEHNKLFVTDKEEATGSVGLLLLYTKRILRAIKILRRRKTFYDSVIASSPFLPDVLPVLRKPCKTRIVILFHLIPKRKGSNFRTRLRFAIARVEQKIALFLIGRYFDTIIAGNSEVKKALKQRFPNKKIIVTHAGIDTKLIDKIPGQKKDKNLGIFAGRLTTQKGILDLVDIAKTVAAKRPKFKLIIIGDGQDKHLLVEKIQAYGVHNIELKGFVDDKTKYSLMKQAGFFIFPSYEEGWGIALAEALYTDALVFCYELPHYRSIFADYPYYVGLGKWKDMSEEITAHYSNNPKKNQIKHAAQYDNEQVIKDILSLIV